MRLRLQKLQDKNNQAQKDRIEQPENANWHNVKDVPYHQGLSYIPKIIQIKLISKYYNNLLAGYFGIEKIYELVAQKYYWLLLYYDVKNYMKECNICPALKAVWHKLYGNLQSLPVPIYRWKDLLIDFVIGLLILTN